MKSEKVFSMIFSDIYPLLLNKAVRKGRTPEEVNEVICWLTGYNENELKAQLDKNVDYMTFFDEAPRMNPRADLITGKICGVTVEDIEEPLMKNIRQLDKLIDELAKGLPMYRILRTDPKDYPVFEFDARLIQNENMDAGYVEIPLDVPKTFGKKRVSVHATFDGVPYDGQIVRMGTVCHIIGVRKDIRKKISKNFGDMIHVTIKER